MRAFQNEDVWYEIFDSFHEFLAHAEGHDPKGASGTGTKQFTGTDTFGEAMTVAKVGYTEIRPDVDKLVSVMQERLAERFGHRYVTYLDVSGANVDMGKFVTGEPECMMEFAQEPAASMGRVVKIVVGGSCSWTIDKQWIINRGTAVVALVDTLHKLGVGVEVWWESNVGGESNGKGNKYTTACKVHDSAEPLDVDSIMFALAHPAMLRRLKFSVQEKSRYGRKSGAYKNYGIPSTLALPRIDTFDVRVEKLQDGRGDIVNNPLEWVITTVEGLGFTE